MNEKLVEDTTASFGKLFLITFCLMLAAVLTEFISTYGIEFKYGYTLFGLILYTPYVIVFSLANSIASFSIVKLLNQRFFNLQTSSLIASLVPAVMVLVWFIVKKFEPQVYNWKFGLKECLIFLAIIIVSNLVVLSKDLRTAN